MGVAEYDPNNVFLKIIKGEIPSYKVFETEHVLAILDAFPVVEGHCLLLPKQEGITTVLDMSPEVAANVYKELPRLAKAVQEAVNCDGINIVQNNGKASGQVVFHAHIHVIPRFNDDKLMKLPAGSSMIEKESASKILAKLHKSLDV